MNSLEHYVAMTPEQQALQTQVLFGRLFREENWGALVAFFRDNADDITSTELALVAEVA